MRRKEDTRSDLPSAHTSPLLVPWSHRRIHHSATSQAAICQFSLNSDSPSLVFLGRLGIFSNQRRVVGSNMALHVLGKKLRRLSAPG